MPAHFSESAASLVAGLLQSDPTRRLGAMKGGVTEMKQHPFFSGTNWATVLAAEGLGPLVARRETVRTQVPQVGPEFENFDK